MPTTDHGAPYPSPLDARDVPAHIQALAQWAEEHAVHIATSSGDRDSRFAGLEPGQIVTTSGAPFAAWLKTSADNTWLTLRADTGPVTSGFAPQDGWSIDDGAMQGRNVSGIIDVRGTVIRTGDDLTANSSGGLPDSPMFVAPVGFRPVSIPIQGLARGRTNSGGWQLSTGGTAILTDLQPNSTVANGDEVRVSTIFLAG